MGVDAGSMRTETDVEELLANYKRGRSKKFLLAAACLFLFLGCFSGFTSLQVAKTQVEAATSTAVELAEVARNSDFCIENPQDPTCIKAGEVVKDPSNVVTGAGNSVIPISIKGISSEDYLANDPLPAVLGLVTAPLVIWRLQLD